MNSIIGGINGPIVTIDGPTDLEMMEMVFVGNARLVGEVIRIDSEATVIQVYEETSGLKPGEPIFATGSPISVTLGPGILSNIFDGIENPLSDIAAASGSFIPRGLHPESLNPDTLWDVTLTAKVGDRLEGGDVYAVTPEKAIEHRIMLSPDLSGEIVEIKPDGKYRVHDTVAVLKDDSGELHQLTLCHRWPIRVPRPIKKRLPLSRPLVTGQRVIDTLFPIAKGGAAAIPGGFGTGKTMTQHQLAKWCDADIIIYVGCGERGNEMTDVLKEFPELNDPRTGLPLMKRTVLIANTSDMPVAAREASIYTGITIAEYYRDMGYKVAIMADSTSRWAEALREMSGRLEEMPGEEGYPAYLSSRLAEFYERAGIVECLGNDNLTGAVTAIGAVSPPGGDTSEPVSQATLRIVKIFWCLSAPLAYKRHFPAIDWLRSYSLYNDTISDYFDHHTSRTWSSNVARCRALLQEEAELDEVVRLVGVDALGEKDRLTLETARSIREDFLQQNAFDAVDTYTSDKKQADMLDIILYWADEGKKALADGVSFTSITSMKVLEEIARMKEITQDKWDSSAADIRAHVSEEFASLRV